MGIGKRSPLMIVSVLAFLLMLAMTGGCASTSDPAAEPAEETVAETEEGSEESPAEEGTVKASAQAENVLAVHDPWHRTNRGIYNWNASIDRHLFIPVIDAYEFAVPEVFRMTIGNFFTNLGNITTFGNQILQLKFAEAGQTATRFAFNSGMGILGIADIASALDMPQYKEDFGQTLGYWGAGEGPYMVLPILGPSNVRDTTGTVTDTVAFSLIDPFSFSSTYKAVEPGVTALRVVDTRYQTPFRYYATGSPFEYEFVRMLYTQKRRFEIQR